MSNTVQKLGEGTKYLLATVKHQLGFNHRTLHFKATWDNRGTSDDHQMGDANTV